MTQERTIIQSGANTLRAYEEDGVSTPASGLEEYFYVILSQFPADQETYEYFLANNMPFKIVSTVIKSTGSGANSSITLFTFKSPTTMEVPVQEGEDNFIQNTKPIIVPTKSTIFIYNNGLVIEDLRFLCQRVALLDPIIPVGKLDT